MANTRRTSAGNALPRAGRNQPGIVVGLLLGLAGMYLSISARTKSVYYMGLVAFLSILAGYYHFDPMESYWTQKHNVLNQYGIKLGWLWTLVCVTPFVFFAGKAVKPTWNRAIHDIIRILCATLLWYVATVQVFNRIQYATSYCDLGASISGRRECAAKGGKWESGVDISGHCFLIIFSALVISEEATAMRAFLKTGRYRSADSTEQLQPLVNGSFIAMALLHLLWDVQLVLSCLYYHKILDKVAGAATAVGCWRILYRTLGERGIVFLPLGRLPKSETTTSRKSNKNH